MSRQQHATIHYVAKLCHAQRLLPTNNWVFKLPQLNINQKPIQPSPSLPSPTLADKTVALITTTSECVCVLHACTFLYRRFISISIMKNMLHITNFAPGGPTEKRSSSYRFHFQFANLTLIMKNCWKTQTKRDKESQTNMFKKINQKKEMLQYFLWRPW